MRGNGVKSKVGNEILHTHTMRPGKKKNAGKSAIWALGIGRGLKRRLQGKRRNSENSKTIY